MFSVRAVRNATRHASLGSLGVFAARVVQACPDKPGPTTKDHKAIFFSQNDNVILSVAKKFFTWRDSDSMCHEIYGGIVKVSIYKIMYDTFTLLIRIYFR